MSRKPYVFIGGVASIARGFPTKTRDLDLIAKTPEAFEAAILSLLGMNFHELKPPPGFAPTFARMGLGDLRADIMLGRIHFRWKNLEQRVVPDSKFWQDVRLMPFHGIHVPVPSAVDLAVLKAVSSEFLGRDPTKARTDKMCARWLISEYSISPKSLLARAGAMRCRDAVQKFLGSDKKVEV